MPDLILTCTTCYRFRNINDGFQSFCDMDRSRITLSEHFMTLPDCLPRAPECEKCCPCHGDVTSTLLVALMGASWASLHRLCNLNQMCCLPVQKDVLQKVPVAKGLSTMWNHTEVFIDFHSVF